MCTFEIVVTENPIVAAIVAAHNATVAETLHRLGQEDGIGAYAERFAPNFRSIQLAVGRSTVRDPCAHRW